MQKGGVLRDEEGNLVAENGGKIKREPAGQERCQEETEDSCFLEEMLLF